MIYTDGTVENNEIYDIKPGVYTDRCSENTQYSERIQFKSDTPTKILGMAFAIPKTFI